MQYGAVGIWNFRSWLFLKHVISLNSKEDPAPNPTRDWIVALIKQANQSKE